MDVILTILQKFLVVNRPKEYCMTLYLYLTSVPFRESHGTMSNLGAEYLKFKTK